MPFSIVWSSNAEEQLRKIDRTVGKRIFKSVGRLTNSPERWLIRLVGSPLYRLRVGDYRVIVNINFQEKRIEIIDLGHRSNIYD